MGKIVAVCTSPKKGMRKKNVGKGNLVVNLGLDEDAHAGFAHRQVSLLALESIEKMQRLGLNVVPGDFAENITTQGINLLDLTIGTRLKVGKEGILKVTQIGKECHQHCEIYKKVGKCVMPTEGIFVKVLTPGTIRPGDAVEIVPEQESGR